jgi:hypothetical protein
MESCNRGQEKKNGLPSEEERLNERKRRIRMGSVFQRYLVFT